MALMTNVLSLPLTGLTVKTGNNEDWIDSLAYHVGDVNGPQLDIRGIYFEMEIRGAPPLHEVVLTASTANGRIKIGAPPDYGFLLFSIDCKDMEMLSAGNYISDIIADANGIRRRVFTVELEIVQGITR